MRKTPLILLALVLIIPGALATFSDSSGNGYALTAQDDPSPISSQFFGAGYAFDGDDCLNHALQPGDLSASSTLHVIADISGASSAVVGKVMQGDGSVGRGYRLLAGPTSAFVYVGTGDGTPYTLSSPPYSSGSVRTITATFTGGSNEVNLYLDGELVASGTADGAISYSTSGLGPDPSQFYVSGTRNNLAGTDCNVEFMTGDIYQVRSFGRVLTPPEISALAVCSNRDKLLGDEVRAYFFGSSPTCPDPPEGVRATLYEIDGGTKRVFVETALSPDDLDKSGGFEYILQRDSGSGFVDIQTLAAGTAFERVFLAQDSYSGAETTLKYRAYIPGGDFSCEITLDITTLDNQEVCGNLAASTVGGGALFGSEGIFFLGNKAARAESLGLTLDGVGALWGVLMVMMITGGGHWSVRTMEIIQRRNLKNSDDPFTDQTMVGTSNAGAWGAYGGAVLGWVMAVIFDLLPFWSLVLALALVFGVKSSGLDFGNTPQKILMVVLFTLTFEGLFFGSEIAEKSFPTFEEPSSTGIFAALEVGLAIIKAVWGGVLFFLNLLTFGLPDVPWWIRIPVGGTLSGATTWSIIQLIRGGGSSE